MRFSWKIFFSTVCITLVIFSVGGYVLIWSLFQSTYDREAGNGEEENRMLQYSFVAYWNTTVQGIELNRENVVQTAEAMLEGMGEGNLRIRLSAADGTVWFDSSNTGPDTGLLADLQADRRGQMLRRTEDGYELQTASMLRPGGRRTLSEALPMS